MGYIHFLCTVIIDIGVFQHPNNCYIVGSLGQPSRVRDKDFFKTQFKSDSELSSLPHFSIQQRFYASVRETHPPALQTGLCCALGASENE